MDKHTATTVVSKFIDKALKQAENFNYFRNENLYNSVCHAYFSIRLTHSLKKLQKEILLFRNGIEKKSKDKVAFSPSFCDFCKKSLEHIYSQLILEPDLSFLLQKRYELLETFSDLI